MYWKRAGDCNGDRKSKLIKIMSEPFKIEKVAVLGTGVMGAQIAAHLTNAKIPVLAFDINQEIAQKGIEGSIKIKPGAYYNPKTVEMITPLIMKII